MNLIKTAIERPIAVIAAVLMVVMFGLVALQTIPIQLAPDINSPVITVTTEWGGAAPAEVEREITNRQEEELKGIEGLEEITSRSERGRSRVTLEFAVGTNMDRALLLVSNRLDRVNGYPDEADEPTLDTAGAEDNAIAWFILTRLEGNERPISEFGDFAEDIIQERLERVPGVSRINVYGGTEQEIQVTVEPQVLARYRLTVSEVVDALRRANASFSAGDVDEGKRRYVVRTEGELNTVEAVRSVVVRSDDGGDSGRLARVRIGDIADVRFGYKEARASIRMRGDAALAMNAIRETGANVIETMEGIRAAIRELNEGPVPAAGLKLRQVYDETVYIDSAIDLVQQNIWVGGLLAALVLYLFLRSGSAVFVGTGLDALGEGRHGFIGIVENIPGRGRSEELVDQLPVGRLEEPHIGHGLIAAPQLAEEVRERHFLIFGIDAYIEQHLLHGNERRIVKDGRDRNGQIKTIGVASLGEKRAGLVRIIGICGIKLGDIAQRGLAPDLASRSALAQLEAFKKQLAVECIIDRLADADIAHCRVERASTVEEGQAMPVDFDRHAGQAGALGFIARSGTTEDGRIDLTRTQCVETRGLVGQDHEVDLVIRQVAAPIIVLLHEVIARADHGAGGVEGIGARTDRGGDERVRGQRFRAGNKAGRIGQIDEECRIRLVKFDEHFGRRHRSHFLDASDSVDLRTISLGKVRKACHDIIGIKRGAISKSDVVTQGQGELQQRFVIFPGACQHGCERPIGFAQYQRVIDRLIIGDLRAFLSLSRIEGARLNGGPDDEARRLLRKRRSGHQQDSCGDRRDDKITTLHDFDFHSCSVVDCARRGQH
mgnify:CR=1 FL=1